MRTFFLGVAYLSIRGTYLRGSNPLNFLDSLLRALITLACFLVSIFASLASTKRSLRRFSGFYRMEVHGREGSASLMVLQVGTVMGWRKKVLPKPSSPEVR